MSRVGWGGWDGEAGLGGEEAGDIVEIQAEEPSVSVCVWVRACVVVCMCARVHVCLFRVLQVRIGDTRRPACGLWLDLRGISHWPHVALLSIFRLSLSPLYKSSLYLQRFWHCCWNPTVQKTWPAWLLGTTGCLSTQIPPFSSGREANNRCTGCLLKKVRCWGWLL